MSVTVTKVACLRLKSLIITSAVNNQLSWLKFARASSMENFKECGNQPNKVTTTGMEQNQRKDMFLVINGEISNQI